MLVGVLGLDSVALEWRARQFGDHEGRQHPIVLQARHGPTTERGTQKTWTVTNILRAPHFEYSNQQIIISN